jgi:hypothetical protein
VTGKNGELSVFSVQRTGGSPTGPDPEKRESDRDIGSQSRPVSSGLKVPSEPRHCRNLHTRGADKFLAQPFSRWRRTESVVSLKREGC